MRNKYTYEIELRKYKNGILDIGKAVQCTKQEFFYVFKKLKLDKIKHSFWDRFFE